MPYLHWYNNKNTSYRWRKEVKNMTRNFEEYVQNKLDFFEDKFVQNDKFQSDVYERFNKYCSTSL